MQLSNLNKTIILIILGASFMVNYLIIDCIRHSDDFHSLINNIIEDIAKKYSASPALLIVISVSLFMFIGLIIESLVSLTRTIYGAIDNIKNDTEKKSNKIELTPVQRITFFLFFPAAHEFNKYRLLQKEIERMKLPGYESGILSARDIGVSIFFRSANPATTNWMINYYVTHLLSAGLALILFADSLFLFCNCEIWSAGITMLLTWFTISQAIDKYYYSYRYLLRFTCMHLNSAFQQHPEKSKKTSTGPSETE